MNSGVHLHRSSRMRVHVIMNVRHATLVPWHTCARLPADALLNSCEASMDLFRTSISAAIMANPRQGSSRCRALDTTYEGRRGQGRVGASEWCVSGG